MTEQFGAQYSNRNNAILEVNKERGVSGLIASWNRSHFKWNKCPTALAG